MDDRERNDREWNDPENWRGPWWAALYFGERDSRVIVRKRLPRFGWTVNLAHPIGRWIFLATIAFAAVVMALAISRSL